MKIIKKIMAVVTMSLMVLSAFAADMGSIPAGLKTNDIKKTPTYSDYKNKDAQGHETEPKSWKEITNKILFSKIGSYNEFSNAYFAPFMYANLAWNSVDQYCQKTAVKGDLEKLAAVVYTKFNQNPHLAVMLTMTGEKVLVDAADLNNNYLGRILMLIRKILS